MALDPLAPLLEPDPDPPSFEETLAAIREDLNLREPWRAQARCRGELDAFFPALGQGGRAKERALELCESCPVRAECLEEALAYEERTRAVEPCIRGGLEPRQRRELLTAGNAHTGPVGRNRAVRRPRRPRCPACEDPQRPGARFCASCGAEIAA